MNLFIAQMVSLISTYNDYINTGNLPKNCFESDIFERCETVGFILIRKYVTRGHLNGDLVGANPIRWFKYLEKDDCQRLTLHFDTDRDKQNDSEKISPYINGTLYIESVYKHTLIFLTLPMVSKTPTNRQIRLRCKILPAIPF